MYVNLHVRVRMRHACAFVRDQEVSVILGSIRTNTHMELYRPCHLKPIPGTLVC